MFRIRRIYDDILPINREEIAQVQNILRTQIHGLQETYIEKLPDQLRNPLKYRFRSILFVADDSRGRIKGFALLQHAADLNFCFLDFISAAPKTTGRGIGGALYERIREECLQLNAIGLFFECLPDESKDCKDSEKLIQNAARLRFYERYGASPIINTAYETPLSLKDKCPPYLVFDNLGQKKRLNRDKARAIVRAIMERKYGDVCPKDYMQMVVDSFKDNPVRLREPKYPRHPANAQEMKYRPRDTKIALVINDKHNIHHVREYGYVESPVRIKSILKGIIPSGLFEELKVRRFSENYIMAVHDSGFVNYLKKVCANVPSTESVYPYVFPIRNSARAPKELPIRAGYYCIDTFTPLNHNAYLAAKRAVDCALTAARSLLRGHRIAYALVRPPGHHAERRAFGGFCYFNAAAVAAQYLSPYGKVAILDIDYHHGNGQQNIFYKRSDILTLSIHGHPRFAYPYFTGFKDEMGSGEGLGFNINYPLPEQQEGSQYRKVLTKAIKKIIDFKPQFLIVALGFDTAKGDPTGTWNLTARDFELNGEIIGELGFPLLVVQEGGYKARSIGVNSRQFFSGLWKASSRVRRN